MPTVRRLLATTDTPSYRLWGWAIAFHHRRAVPGPAPGYTPFGQSNWSLTAQATFAASLPCMANTSQVLDLMGQITSSPAVGHRHPGQHRGLQGRLGPGADRRVPVAPDGRGPPWRRHTNRAGSGRPPADGSFDTGISDLNAMAGWVAANIRSGGTNRC